jgi:hypothetical protein
VFFIIVTYSFFIARINLCGPSTHATHSCRLPPAAALLRTVPPPSPPEASAAAAMRVMTTWV